MAKPINLSIQFSLPESAKTSSLSLKPSGEIFLIDEDGKEIVPDYMERALHYDRPKGPKVQGRHKQTNSFATVGGLKELASYDSIFVIDTNTKTLEQGKVSAACFICIQVIPEGEKFKIACEEGRLNTYEFHNASGNPELLSILKIAKDVLNSEGKQKLHNIAIVTDTELGSHDGINSRTTPIFGPHCLPPGFTLLYASSDTGSEVLNKLIRFCDRQADEYIKNLEHEAVNVSNLQMLSEDNSVKYRFLYRTDLTIINPIVGGISIAEGTKVTLYGKKK